MAGLRFIVVILSNISPDCTWRIGWLVGYVVGQVAGRVMVGLTGLRLASWETRFVSEVEEAMVVCGCGDGGVWCWYWYGLGA